jgi:hypothetical protein
MESRLLRASLCALLGDISLAVIITGNMLREPGVTLEDLLK